MKKFFTLMAAIVMAMTLSMPVFAAPKKHKKTHTTTQSKSKKHNKHSKKKHGKKGMKKS